MPIEIFGDKIVFQNYQLKIGRKGLIVQDLNGNTAPFSVPRGQPTVIWLEGIQGSVSGYSSGGFTVPPITTSASNIIDKFPFASNANATDVGDLTQTRYGSAGQSSLFSGYTSGGYTPPAVPGGGFRNTIDKFLFATNANATDVGDLTQNRSYLAGQSSEVNGYSTGGLFSPPPVTRNTIDKFPFATNANATDVGDLTTATHVVAGQSSIVSGYTSGGTPPVTNTIDKFPFATDANATDVGDLTVARFGGIGQSSGVSGYTSGGTIPPFSNTIDKFPFAADSNATDVGDLTQARTRGAGQSSTVSGYSSGGYGPGRLNTIDKFPFAADSNATDVGDLTVARYDPAGQQV
jgi:hypothetical protein